MLNTDAIYMIDSLPIAVCDNIRIWVKKYSTEDFRGYQASKKRYFYGLKVHLMVTQVGSPLNAFYPWRLWRCPCLSIMRMSCQMVQLFMLIKPIMTNEIENLLKVVEQIQLLPIRKKNSKRALSPSVAFVESYHRKRVEITPGV